MAGLLSRDVPTPAPGTCVVVPGSSAAPGSGPVRTVQVEVEDGLPVDGATFADFVLRTLNDPHRWGTGTAVQLPGPVPRAVPPAGHPTSGLTAYRR